MKTRKIFSRIIQMSVMTVLALPFISPGGTYTSFVSAAEDFFQALGATQFEDRLDHVDFSLPSVSGAEVKLSDFEGKVVFLNFWATWCPYCRTERSALQSLYDKYKDKEFVVLSVSIDRSGIDTVKKFVEAHELTFPNLHDQTSKVALEYGIRGVPVTLFIDKKGKVGGGVIGPRAWNSEEAYGLIEQLLSEEE